MSPRGPLCVVCLCVCVSVAHIGSITSLCQRSIDGSERTADQTAGLRETETDEVNWRREVSLSGLARVHNSNQKMNAFNQSLHTFPRSFTRCHSCCVSKRRETHFLFCSSRNVGHPDRLAFQWRYTAESFPCGFFFFLSQTMCVTMFVCFYSYLSYQRTRPHPGTRGSGKHKPGN